MRNIGFAITLLGAVGAMAFAGPALAGPGQCYDAYGRPIGPVYDTDHPNYGFLDSVQRRGGSCGDAARGPQRPNYNYNQGYNPRYRNDGYRQPDYRRRQNDRPPANVEPPNYDQDRSR